MFFTGSKILVIGGTGTIGKNIVRSLLKENPKMIKVLSRDEYKLHQLQNEMLNSKILKTVIGDVRDYDSLDDAMKDIDYVFHVAAMKHVDFCESNPFQAVKTNIYGTSHVIKAAISNQVKKVVFTSTDKAISPTNTYGATKLIAERQMKAVEENKSEGQTIFSTVRFGNVMGSRGSVIPLFKEQIMNNQKVRITDPQITRFMMTVEQATELTIKALKTAKGGEVFVLKMPVVRLGDLATLLINETCKRIQINPDEVEIEEIGLRDGEKMYEELMTFDESSIAWELPDMYVIPSNSNKDSNYEHATKTQQGIYSSAKQKPVNMGELHNLLTNANLI